MYPLLFGTTDGNVEMLLLPSFIDESEPSECRWVDGVSGEEVVGYIRSPELPLSSYDITKQLRRAVFIHSQGNASISPKYYYRGMDGKFMFQFQDFGSYQTYMKHNEGTINDGDPITMPGSSNDTPDYRTSPRRFRTVMLEAYVTGKAWLKNIIFEYRNMRDR
jgi:hypothetical protein